MRVIYGTRITRIRMVWRTHRHGCRLIFVRHLASGANWSEFAILTAPSPGSRSSEQGACSRDSYPGGCPDGRPVMLGARYPRHPAIPAAFLYTFSALLRDAISRACSARDPRFPLPRAQRSRMAVTPMPPAVQMEMSPRPLPFCTSNFASVATMRAPVAANGCPIATLPPLMLSLARSIGPSG